MTRNIYSFQKFLEAATFSQGAPLNISSVATDCGVERRTVTNYFELLNDLLISIELPLFTKRAKRELIKHRKFYFFDAGLFRTLRPKGPLDSENELNRLVLETLVLQEINALNSYLDWQYQLFYWHTKKHEEVDFFSMELFKNDYPEAKCFFLYTGEKNYWHKEIQVFSIKYFFSNMSNLF